MQLNVVHYFYFLAGNSSLIKQNWQLVCQGAEENRAPEFLQAIEKTWRQKISLLSSVTATDFWAYLYLYNDLVIITLGINPKGTGSEQQALVRLEGIRRELSQQREDFLGEATVQQGDHAEQWDITGSTPFGCLGHQLKAADRHFYFIKPEGTLDWVPFLACYLPLLDLRIFLAQEKTTFFLEQFDVIRKDKETVDREVGSILHQQIDTNAATPEKIRHLEETVEKLASLYGTLASNASIIKNFIKTLTSDIKKIDEAGKLLANPGEKNIIAAHYSTHFQGIKLDFNALSEQLQMSLANAKAALDVIQTRVNLARSGESMILQGQMNNLLDQNLKLQKEGLSLQVAAAFIEFIVVIYYSLSIKTKKPK